jgi:hypothetical protein
MRIFIALALAALALPAAADEALEKKLKAIEARVAELRAQVLRERALSEERKNRIAKLDKAIAEAKAQDKTALGATRIEELRAERERLATEQRGGRRALARKADDTANDAEAVARRKKEASALDALVKRAQAGDAKARAELTRMKQKIDRALAVRGVPAQQVLQIGAFQGAAGRLVLVNGVNGIGLGGGSRGPAPAATAKKPKKKVATEEQAKLTAADVAEQEKRAARLELQVVDLTRKVLALEKRLRDLQEKVAAEEAR